MCWGCQNPGQETSCMPLQIEEGSLGSPPGEQILHELQPSHWFSAHLHVKYAALVAHSHQQDNQQRQGQGRGQKRKSPSRGPSPPPGLGQGQKGRDKFTKFLALDKCLPRRGFLQVGFADLGGSLVWSIGCRHESSFSTPPTLLFLSPSSPPSCLLHFVLSATVLGRAAKHAEHCTCNVVILAKITSHPW